MTWEPSPEQVKAARKWRQALRAEAHARAAFVDNPDSKAAKNRYHAAKKRLFALPLPGDAALKEARRGR